MRIHLKGEGEVIPDYALPDAGIEVDLKPLVVDLSNAGFDKRPYVAMGYNTYEVWCIGGAGGQGGGISDQAQFLVSRTRPKMSSSDWNLYLELMVIYAGELTPPYGPYGGTVAGTQAYYQSQFPNHDPYFVSTYRTPFLLENGSALGGGGGGGGLHTAAGFLDDLADITPVVVGQAGAQGVLGQSIVNGAWDPPRPNSDLIWSPANTRRKELENYFNNFQNKYPTPHPTFLPPQHGQDGGASTFGGTICRASGGKGGRASKVWTSGVLTKNGAGGAGGLGGQTVAGGGAAGSNTADPGEDGFWAEPIGEGGGGGRGGDLTVQGTDGGRGNYSFSDTSVFGLKEARSYFKTKSYTYDNVTGAITSVIETSTGQRSVPGGGGGANVLGRAKGGEGLASDPNGAVVIRLTKVE